jgi:hypothetical protein
MWWPGHCQGCQSRVSHAGGRVSISGRSMRDLWLKKLAVEQISLRLLLLTIIKIFSLNLRRWNRLRVPKRRQRILSTRRVKTQTSTNISHYFCRILIKLAFLNRLSIIGQYKISWKFVQWERSCSMRTHTQTGMHGEANNRFSQFCERA